MSARKNKNNEITKGRLSNSKESTPIPMKSPLITKTGPKPSIIKSEQRPRKSRSILTNKFENHEDSQS